MKTMDPGLPKLTENDRLVLKKILDSNKLPDSEIAKTMHISPQAVFKIREKLQNSGIIKGYMPIIDYKKIGINVMLLLVIRLTSNVWKNFSDDQISEKISKAPYIINAYRVADENASHILLLGFRDTEQKENYISQIQTKFSQDIQIKASYTFSVDKVISQNTVGLLHEIINKKEYSPEDLFLSR